MTMKRFSMIGLALLTMLAAQADGYPTTSYEISNWWLMKWTGPETDIDFLSDPNLQDRVDGIYGYAFDGNTTLRTIRFGRRISDISMYAFKDCSSLETVVFDDTGGNVIDHPWISDNAFYNCPKLKSVTFSEYTERLTGDSFDNCPSLTRFSISKSHPDWTARDGILYTKDLNKLKLFPQGITGHHDLNSKVVEIDDYAFYQSRLKTIYMSDKLERIGEDAFHGANQLTTIVFPNSLREIGSSAFRKCESLKTLILPPSLETINAYAFSRCPSLPETIKIPASVTTIGGPICGECPTVKRFEVADGNVFFSTREGALYDYQGEKLIDWPWGTIGDAITIPEGTTIVGNGVFQFAPMKTVNLPSSLKEIGENAFGLSNLEKISIPEGLTKIGSYAFAWCSNLREIELPSTLAEMGNQAFVKRGDIHRAFTCHALIPVGKTPENWGDLSTDTLYVPEESLDLYTVSPGWRNFGTIKPIPVPKYFDVTFTQSSNGLLLVYNNDDEIESGTEVKEGSSLTIKVFLFPGYKLSSLQVNGEDVETSEDSMGMQCYTFTVTGPIAITVSYASATGIDAVRSEDPAVIHPESVFDLQGRPVNHLGQKGIFILKTPNGEEKKILVR